MSNTFRLTTCPRCGKTINAEHVCKCVKFDCRVPEWEEDDWHTVWAHYGSAAAEKHVEQQDTDRLLSEILAGVTCLVRYADGDEKAFTVQAETIIEYSAYEKEQTDDE